jgi:aspartate carbamoyltransferase regulatory subunit
MSKKKTELQVAALENGTAIDHIPSEQLFKVVSLLGIEKLKTPVTIGYNLDSKKMGSKGILKISDKFFEENEINRISLIAPTVNLNIIKDYEVIEKKQVQLPDEIKGIVKCNNPKCISNNEPMKTVFSVIDKQNVTLKCHYCELKIKKEDIVLLCRRIGNLFS